MTEQPGDAASLDQMRTLLAQLPDGAAPAPPGDTARAVLERLGRRRIERPRLAIFAAAHGVAARLPAAAGPDTRQLIEAILERRAPIVAAAETIDADLRLYEMAWPRPTGDITAQPALDEAACTAAMAYGMVSVDETIDLLCLSALGSESATAAQAVGLALLGGQAADWAAPAAAPLIAQAVARHGEAAADAIELLRRLGGEDIAAIAGAILAGCFAALPVVLDGLAALAAAALLQRAAPAAVGHCLLAGDDGSPAWRRLAEALGLPAVPGAKPGDGGAAAVAALRAELARTIS